MASNTRFPHWLVTPEYGGSHQTYAWWHADEAARLAEPVTRFDHRRWSLQLDTEEVWEFLAGPTDSVVVIGGQEYTKNLGTWKKRAPTDVPASALALDAAPAAARHVYVSPTGSDSGDGSASAPLKTVGGVWAKIPRVLAGPVIVHFASGSYEWAEPPPLLQRGTGSYVALLGDGGGQSGDTGVSVIASGTCTGTSARAYELVATGLTPDALIGCTLEILTGACAGNRRAICANTATLITLDFQTQLSTATGTSAPALLAAGDGWRVTRPAVKFTNPGAGSIALNPHAQLIHAVNVSFPTLITSTPSVGVLQFWGLESRTLNAPTGAQLQAGVSATASLIAALGLPSGINAYGWGVLWPESTRGTYSCGAGGQFTGFVIAKDGVINCSGNLLLYGGRFSQLTGFQGSAQLGITSGQDLPVWVVPATASDGLIVRGGLRVEVRARLQADVRVSGVLLIAATEHGRIILSGQHRIALSAAVTSFTLLYTSGQAGVYLTGLVGTDSVVIDVPPLSTPAINTLVCLAGVVQLEGRIACNQNAGSSSIYDAAQVQADVLELTSTGAPALTLRSGGKLHLGRWGANPSPTVLTAKSPSAALVLERGSRLVANASATLTCVNTDAGQPNRDAILVNGGAELNCYSPPVTLSAGSSGYGINARGGGRVCVGILQPVGVTGPTADFSIGVNVGDDFNDTDLAVPYAARVSGSGYVQRTF